MSSRPPFFTSARGRLLIFNLLVVAVTLMVSGVAVLGFRHASQIQEQVQQQTLDDMTGSMNLARDTANVATAAVRLSQVVGSLEYKGEAERLKQMDMEEIAGMFVENSDEPYAEEIAREIAKRNRKRQYIETTTGLKEVIETTLSFIPEKERKEAVKKSCQRCFQALRIDVNQEFEVLESFLTKLPGILAPGGRAAILTFHSGEDRLVKYYFKEGKKDGLYSDVANDVIRPSAEECQRNPRARSTKMRWAIREGENSHRN